jgi:hypothetical protein
MQPSVGSASHAVGATQTMRSGRLLQISRWSLSCLCGIGSQYQFEQFCTCLTGVPRMYSASSLLLPALLLALSRVVVASEKGVVVGRLTFTEDGDDIDCRRMGVGGKAIPPNISKVILVGATCARSGATAWCRDSGLVCGGSLCRGGCACIWTG